MPTPLPETGQQVIVTPDNRISTETYAIQAPEPDEVLVETICTLISAGTELGTQEQVRGHDFTPGYSNVGRILAVGADAKEYRVGDRVLSLAPHASHVISSTAPHSLRPIPDGVTDAEATFGVLGSVAMHGVRKARIELGEHVLVTGMGLVGQLVLRLVTGSGAETLTAVDLVDERLARAEAGGALHTVNPRTTDLKTTVDQVTQDRGLDVVIEASGYPDVLPQAFDLCRIGGRIILLGSIWHRKVEIDFMDFHEKELVLMGCHQPKCPIHPTATFPWTQQYNRGQILTMIADGRLDVRSLITHHLPFTEAKKGYRLLQKEQDQALGVVLQWQR
jgi:L-iditol 2-dehydrogenase